MAPSSTKASTQGLRKFLRNNEDSGNDSAAAPKKRRVEAASSSSSSSSWIAADERKQIDEAIRRSLQSDKGEGEGAAEGEGDAVVPATMATSGHDRALTGGQHDLVASKHDVDAGSSALPPPPPPSVAPLFNAKPSSSASSSAVTPRPVFTADDFQPLTSATVVNRLDSSLDCLFWPRWMSPTSRESLRTWMLSELAWHRVCYTRPGGMRINTPRFTATFGIDDTGAPATAYRVKPKPIPPVLAHIKDTIERLQQGDADVRYNALIINYYATGDDSISYHSDDEAFLGVNPNIASLSLGATRDFYLRRKAPAGVAVPSATSPSGSKGAGPAASRPTEKMQLLDGSLLIMRGKTQAEWEHAIPKRKNIDQGRINITFRRAISPKAINNFITYNRGTGPVYRWRGGKMVEASGGI